MEANDQLKGFLAPYDPDIQALGYALRAFITSTIPEANELIWDNYNAVAIAYSKSEQLKDAFCHLAVYAKHLNFGFNRGVELSNKLIKLEGKGKLIRHLKVTSMESFPRNEMEEMIYEAVGIADHRNQQLVSKTSKGVSLVRSVSAKKVRPK